MQRRSLATFVLILLSFASCRTTMHPVTSFEPLAAASGEDALTELRKRAEVFRGERALVRIRATTAGTTRSFRAQLFVRDSKNVEITAYTPVGTVAASLVADGNDVTIREAGGQERRGNAAELGSEFGIFKASITPAEVAMLITGLPPANESITYEMTPRGIAHATAGELSFSYDPAVYPPQRVTIERGADRVEVEFLELGAPQ